MVKIVSFHVVLTVSTKHVIDLMEPVCPYAKLIPMVINAMQVILTYPIRTKDVKSWLTVILYRNKVLFVDVFVVIVCNRCLPVVAH